MARKIRSITQCRNLKGKRVLVRVDFNVPLQKGKVTEDSRLRASLPTIQYLVKNKAIVLLVTHLGRPEGKRAKEFSLTPVRKKLSTLLDKPVVSLENILSTKFVQKVNALKSGDIALLDNIRFYSGEENNDKQFTKVLASLADMFVLDGFAVAHRKAASTTGVTSFLPSYAGLLLEKEIHGLNKVLRKPKKPFVLVIGGAKIETKLPIIKHMVPLVNAVLWSGGLLNTYLWAKGYKVGVSILDKKFKIEALRYGMNKKIVQPIDVIVGTRDGKSYRVVDIQKKPHILCKHGEGIFDIGPKTIRLFAHHIKQAKTLVWNGAMGYFEQKPYHVGTFAIARLVAARSKGRAFGVIGGGETLQAMDMVGMSDDIDLVSTGGGAMLEYLAGKRLVGIEGLKKN